MKSLLPILLLGFAGILIGGVYSLVKQGASRGAIVGVALLAMLSTAAGVLWLFQEA